MQNHNYAVDPATLPKGVEVTHINLNDGTCAGLAYPALNVMSLQYHPEASPGPHDSDCGNAFFDTIYLLHINLVFRNSFWNTPHFLVFKHFLWSVLKEQIVLDLKKFHNGWKAYNLRTPLLIMLLLFINNFLFCCIKFSVPAYWLVFLLQFLGIS